MNGFDGMIAIDERDTNFIQQTDESDQHIEEILNRQKKVAATVLNKHKKVLVEISKELLKNNTIKKEEFEEKYKDVFQFKKTSHDTSCNYHELLMNA